jgi:hypothetical protein
MGHAERRRGGAGTHHRLRSAMLPVDVTDRLHIVIDQAARAAAEPFNEARNAIAPAHRPVFDRLASRAERTVRLAVYEYLNEHELA